LLYDYIIHLFLSPVNTFYYFFMFLYYVFVFWLIPPFFTLIYPCVRKQSADMLVFAFSRPLSCVLSTSPSIYAPKYQTSVERLKLPLELIEEK
jgi:hypothetical protein